MRIALLHSRVRVEERLLLEELASLGIDHELIDARELVFDIHSPDRWSAFDAVIDRCIGQTQALAAIRVLERFGVRTVNPAAVIETCGDKLATSLLLARHGIPTPRTCVALDEASALSAVERIGYPAVLKPTTGSWGRLLARVNDRDAAEAVIEHKSTLGSVQHSVFYVQEYVEKPDRDLRVFVVGQDAICGIVRRSSHWITNTARGGSASVLEITPEIRELCASAARAVAGNAGGLLAIDLLEAPDRGLLVSEINHTMEFRNSIAPTGVNIPRRMIQWVVDTSHNAITPRPAALHGSASPGSPGARSSSAPADIQHASRSPGANASVLEELKLGPWAAFDAHSRTGVA